MQNWMGIHAYNTHIFRQTYMIQTIPSKFDERLFSHKIIEKKEEEVYVGF